MGLWDAMRPRRLACRSLFPLCSCVCGIHRVDKSDEQPQPGCHGDETMCYWNFTAVHHRFVERVVKDNILGCPWFGPQKRRRSSQQPQKSYVHVFRACHQHETVAQESC